MVITGVDSSTVKTIGYDESLALLRLEFRSEAIYDYFGVPASIHAELLSAPSIGACFNQIVRGRFDYRQIDAMALGTGKVAR